MKALAVTVTIALCSTAVGMALIGAAPPHTTLRGYGVAASERERAVEAQFADIPSAQNALEETAAIAARPHYAGTPADRELALFMRDRLRSYGIAAELEPLRTRVDTPHELVLELAPAPGQTGPAASAGRRARRAGFPVALDLRESPEPSDPATAERSIGLPFNAGSGDGDVSAPLVFADRGLDDDYITLAGAGIDVRGAVVLVRYGAQFRGLLAERAQARGALGVVFYSDPKDDGSARGPVYPDGPWRPPGAIQRGSVGANITIPTLPISAANAQLLLASLRGVAGPAAWGGALPVAYPLARGPGRVHLIVKLDRKTTTLWNTVGTIAGLQANQRVILGAHRDAWVYGVGDNGAGVVTMLEVARGLGFLLAGGWRPQRTIVIAGWDGEEIGLAGSRAYAALHLTELQRGGVAYLNADENITGPAFAASAAAAIAPVIVDATRLVLDPATATATVYERWAAQTPRARPRVTNPGGGSDHESFLTAAGIPVANMSFDGPFGVYHSSYDTLRYASLFSDPNFALHRTAAQLYGTVALRLADADVVPYTFGGYVPVLRAGLAEIVARAARDHRAVDPAAISRAVDRLARATVRIDTLIAQASSADAQRELGAAHALDALAYGANGYASATFPDIAAAWLARDPAALGAAIARTADTIVTVANDLGGSPPAPATIR